MSLRCMNQQFSEQFRRVISSDFVFALTGCSRDWPFFAAREVKKARNSSSFCLSGLTRTGVGASARFASSRSFLETRSVGGKGSVFQLSFRAQGFSSGLRRNSSSSRVVGIGLGEPLTGQHFPSSRAVYAMGQKKREGKELKNGSAVWKEKPNARGASTAAEVCRADAETTVNAGECADGTNCPGDPNGASTTAADSVPTSEAVDVEMATEEIITKEVHVDAMLLRFLVGKGGSTKEKIEKSCKVKLKVPSTYEAKTSKSACVLAGNEAGIEAAQKQIKAILDEAVQSKLQYTHFISLPLAIHPDLLEQVEMFQERILSRNQPTRATASSVKISGPSNEEKTEKVKAAVNGKKLSPQVEPKDTETEDEVKNPKAEVVDTTEEKVGIMDDAKNLEAEVQGMKKRSFEQVDEEKEDVKSPKDKVLDCEKLDRWEEVTSLNGEVLLTEKCDRQEGVGSSKAEILHVEKSALGEEIVYTAEVMDMEKGVVEVEVIPHKSGIDKSIFVKPRTFHLTVLMLKLWNEERVQQAAEVLEKTQAAVHEILEGRPVVVDFRGVDTLRGKPDKAHVLYARVEDSAEKSRLLQACQVLIDAYVESGLVMEKDIGQGLKLHATLMNTTHRTVKRNHRFGKRIPFDATEILEQYSEWRWGEFGIMEAHLSQRFVYGENGYYHCVKSIPLPSSQPRSFNIQVESAEEQ